MDDKIKNLLCECDIFIYQPLSNIYPIYNTEHLLSYLKPNCKIISFPYIFNDAFTPLYKTFIFNSQLEYPESRDNSIKYVNCEPILNL
jgi:hypothetical protein